MLIALLALTGLALIFGAILGYAAIRFKVEADPLVDQIDDILPQTQCGQCGYPGCRPYAEAIANGDAINKCPPGGDAAIKKLAMGELDRIDFSPAYEAHADEVARAMREKKVPKITEMFAEAKQVGSFTVIACSAGLEYMSVKHEDLASKVDKVMGLPLILNLAADAETTLFI